MTHRSMQCSHLLTQGQDTSCTSSSIVSDFACSKDKFELGETKQSFLFIKYNIDYGKILGNDTCFPFVLKYHGIAPNYGSINFSWFCRYIELIDHVTLLALPHIMDTRQHYHCSSMGCRQCQIWKAKIYMQTTKAHNITKKKRLSKHNTNLFPNP